MCCTFPVTKWGTGVSLKASVQDWVLSSKSLSSVTNYLPTVDRKILGPVGCTGKRIVSSPLKSKIEKVSSRLSFPAGIKGKEDE